MKFQKGIPLPREVIEKRKNTLRRKYKEGFLIPWCKGKKLSKEIIEKRRGRVPWNKNKKGCQVAWNKGMKFPEYSGRNNSCWKEKIKKICQYCNKEFEVLPSLQRIKCCSQKCYWEVLKTKSSWMKDKKHSKEARLKISIALKGHMAWNKGKKCPQFTGKNHPLWKGGITPLYKTIRELLEYKQWRNKIYQRDNYICQECFVKSRGLHAHHKNKTFNQLLGEFLHQYSQFSPIEDKETLVRLAMTYEPFWDIENGITLCKKCHKKTNTYLVGGGKKCH